MNDLATQAYIAYLHDVIKKHERLNELKDELIKSLESTISIQDTALLELKRAFEDAIKTVAKI